MTGEVYNPTRLAAHYIRGWVGPFARDVLETEELWPLDPRCPAVSPIAAAKSYREAVAARAAEVSREAVEAWRRRHPAVASAWRGITRWDRVPAGGCPAKHLDPGTSCPYGGTCSTLPICRRRALERPRD
jgi:hypothetical protein